MSANDAVGAIEAAVDWDTFGATAAATRVGGNVACAGGGGEGGRRRGRGRRRGWGRGVASLAGRHKAGWAAAPPPARPHRPAKRSAAAARRTLDRRLHPCCRPTPRWAPSLGLRPCSQPAPNVQNGYLSANANVFTNAIPMGGGLATGWGGSGESARPLRGGGAQGLGGAQSVAPPHPPRRSA